MKHIDIVIITISIRYALYYNWYAELVKFIFYTCKEADDFPMTIFFDKKSAPIVAL
jgi:hypothetical protein